MATACEDLATYLRREFVMISWGEFDGMNDNPDIGKLYALKGLVEAAINEKKSSALCACGNCKHN